MKKKGLLLGLWSKQLSTTAQKQNAAEDKFGDSSTKINPTTEHIPLEFTPESDQFREPESETEIEQMPVASNSKKSINTASVSKPKPAEEDLKTQISLIDEDLVGLYYKKSAGFLTEEQESELKEKKTRKKELERLLKRKIYNKKKAQKSRDSKKMKLSKLCETHPEIQRP
ncbi:hypothetical protein OUZ56_023910 [Daphnia magna]|uniref:Uncharacterized protein n=1 Tax=Daphnia magna TaxID=35525 RepID=A0ABR0AZS7_9CRUS|nr:hypothetical protein OUZ56_023910 [Daphnia magna]